MFNTLKNKVYSYFYSNFVKRFYTKVSQFQDTEEIYYRKNKLVVLVKSQEIGQQILEIVKTLKDRNDTIHTAFYMSFKIDNYIMDINGGVQLICIDFELEREWNTISKVEILQELVGLVDHMQDKGYILDESKFENEKCSSISSFLSFFAIGDENVKPSQGCIVKYIHYVLSNGGDLDEFYREIVSSNAIYNISEFPYSLPVIRMCYNYFLTGDVPSNIFNVLVGEKYSTNEKYVKNFDIYLVPNSSNLGLKFSIKESNEKYTIYDGNIKIYHSMSSEFKEFLRNQDSILSESIDKCMENVYAILMDFNENIIGYKYEEVNTLPDCCSILDKNFISQYEVIEFMSEISGYLLLLNNRLRLKVGEKSKLNIEEALICTRDNLDFEPQIANVYELFNLATIDKDCLKEQITVIFFKLYSAYLKQKYGEMHDEEQFLNKGEVRYISPILAREFIQYALEKQVDYSVAANEFFKFAFDTIKVINKKLVYDSRFEYVPKIVPFTFTHEAEKKYGIKIEKDMNEELTDGRKLVTFGRSRKISKLKEREDSLRKEILEKIGEVENPHVKILEISEIICSKNIGADGMYNVVGYITKPAHGKLLTDEVLLGLNNRDLFKVAGYLFRKFDRYYIPWDTIWMDNDFMFYINILDENFKIRKFENSDSKVSFMEWMVHYLIEKGYNSNAFIDLDFSLLGHGKPRDLLSLADSFDAYCDEHDIYYYSFGDKECCPICQRTKYFVTSDFVQNANEIFEDYYAKHYSIDKRYNLKIYKEACVDLAEAEENIDKIVSSRVNSKKIELGQDCFIPYKKALNHNKKFIGYIYDKVLFDNTTEGNVDVCNDIKNPQSLKNLSRLMSLIRLILQIKENTKRNLGFIHNPFSHVFLSKGHKKQVQILNIEFLNEKGSVEDTLKWTYEYVREVLASDVFIEVDISDCSEDLECILERLQAVAKDMTKFCPIHNMYYSSKYLFCPKCIDEVETKHLELEEVEKSQITMQKEDNEGGESFIYSYGTGLIAKVFKEEINYVSKGVVIAHVLRKRDELEEINSKNLKYRYIIPQKILIDRESKEIFGYTMTKVNDGIPLSSLRDKAEIEKLQFTMQDVLEILITVGTGIEALHANNIYIGDLNGRNILFDVQKNVYFLDFDGMGVDDIAPEFCTDEYIDPVSQKNRNITMKDDWYSFAVQAFHYLTYTHPFNGIYSVEENETKRNLEITEKMERRISLLGNHGMKPPAITRLWYWMSEELKTAFLNIFEGDSRESIIPYLVRQYEFLYHGGKQYGNIFRVNAKFIAKEFVPFEGNVIRIINNYTAICKEDGAYYTSILVSDKEQKKLASVPSVQFPYLSIKNVLLSDNKQIAFVINGNEVIAIDLNTDTKIYTGEISHARDVVVNGNTLYFTRTLEGGNVIFQIDFMSNGEVKEQKIKFLTDRETRRFYAKFNSKFILVKRSSNNTDEIYCNSEKLCDLSYSSENSEYTIIYDDFTKKWLVVNSEGNGIIIEGTNGTYKKFNIEESIDGMNIANISFYKGFLYIPSKDCLHIINMNDQMTAKKMECPKIMTPDSRLYDICTNGFSVITDQMLYEVSRG